ncbi:sigma-54-dependent Fis family transcriptional regulator [Bremerella cremea]|uniref:DNA-binding transcriptional regulator NtrC n=1 Tax=Blastopirellula marina TaxID=124 RepID=A0A2S8F8P7_9BACT|nr:MULTISPECIES: sigma-54 dependent transcriptional regulator [Pirellulaceae]PQO28531.1 Fis family transcriptional regulator [Blastopirellula marina]RCS41901.1 sigma-54-dependent Fis family transcriptional regulator [Bremerella cremea]
MPKLLVIDDDRTVHRLVEKTFEETGVTTICCGVAEDGLNLIRTESPDALLLDIMLREANGLELATQIRHLDPKLPIIFITAMNDSDTAIQAMSRGAYDYLLKPLNKQEVQDLVERAFDTRRLMQSPVHMQEATSSNEQGDLLVGRSQGMLDVYKKIGRVAPQDVAVLILGESGTGKELIARAIYHHSSRRNECFMAINCAALSDTLLESELFGHEKGAFTGADRRHIGKFEQCNGGTIFLDEIGDMSPSTQSKVLRLLQEQKFERVGGTETIETDVRIISATNRDLEQMIEDGEFRLDLYHRLNTFQINLPPLRERGADVQLLLEHFLARFNKSLKKHISGISDEAVQMLLSYPWPGNIRELQAILRKAMLMAVGPVLVPEFFPTELHGNGEASPIPVDNRPVGTPGEDFQQFLGELEAASSTEMYAEALEWMERQLITRVLTATEGNQSKAAEKLGITRGSLRNKIRSLNISIDHVISSDE